MQYVSIPGNRNSEMKYRHIERMVKPFVPGENPVPKRNQSRTALPSKPSRSK